MEQIFFFFLKICSIEMFEKIKLKRYNLCPELHEL